MYRKHNALRKFDLSQFIEAFKKLCFVGRETGVQSAVK
jgi:hypothetical protein